jgi:hypothetical protein
MRQPYEQNLDQNYKPELSYEECLRIVKGMEAVRKYHLANSSIVEWAARLMQHDQIHHLPSLNLLIEDMAAKKLGNVAQSPAIVVHPKPATFEHGIKHYRVVL